MLNDVQVSQDSDNVIKMKFSQFLNLKFKISDFLQMEIKFGSRFGRVGYFTKNRNIKIFLVWKK